MDDDKPYFSKMVKLANQPIQTGGWTSRVVDDYIDYIFNFLENKVRR